MKRFLNGLYEMSPPRFEADTGAGGGTEDKTFTQEELDQIVADRLGRERKKYADYDDKTKRLQALESAEEKRKKDTMTEIEKLKAEKEEAIQTAEQSLNLANQRLIQSTHCSQTAIPRWRRRDRRRT